MNHLDVKKPHFDIVVLMDCMNLDHLTYDFLDNRLPNGMFSGLKLNDYSATMANYTRMMLNIINAFSAPIFTYDHIINANYSRDPTTDSNLLVETVYKLPNVTHIRNLDEINGGIYTASGPLKQLLGYSNEDTVKVLICGLDLSACVVDRELGIHDFFHNGNKVYIHDLLVSDGGDNLINAKQRRLAIENIYDVCMLKGKFGESNGWKMHRIGKSHYWQCRKLYKKINNSND